MRLPDTAVSIALDWVTLPGFLYFALPAVWVGALLVISAYQPRAIRRPADEFLRVLIGAFLATMVSGALLYLTVRTVPRWLFIIFSLLNLAGIMTWRAIFRYALHVLGPQPRPRRALIVGANRVGLRVGRLLQQTADAEIELCGYLDDDAGISQNGALPKIVGRTADAPDLVRRQAIDDVIIALPENSYRKIHQLVVNLQQLPVDLRLVPDSFNLSVYGGRAEDFGSLPLLTLREPVLSPPQRAVKRLFDVAGAALALLLATPLLVLAAVLIRFDSRGPIFFKQTRVGENGDLFHMFKFRTMVENAAELQAQVNTTDENGNLLHKRQSDPRITRVGRILRRLSLDELPQLFNVLRGEMSLVGPRPELPWLVARYEPWQRRRFQVPQGITGWWQVNGRSDRPLHLHTGDDLFYIQHYSLWMDLYIILKTPLAVLRGRGAY